jgi:hypothetical protein
MNTSFTAPPSQQQSSGNIWAMPSPATSQPAYNIAPPHAQSPYSGFGIAPPPAQQQRADVVNSVQTRGGNQNQSQMQGQRQGMDKYESLL